MNEPTSQPQDYLNLYLQAELARMSSDWCTLIEESPTCPPWRWSQISEALLSLTGNPVQELMIRGGLSGLVKQARFKPPELVLEELIRLVRASHDQVLQGQIRETLEAEMP